MFVMRINIIGFRVGFPKERVYMILSKQTIIQNGIDGITIGDIVQTNIFGVIHKQCFETPLRLCGGGVCVDSIGAFTSIGANVDINRVKSIGRFCSIADFVAIGLTEHPTNLISTSLIFTNDTFNWHEKYHTLYEDEAYSKIKADATAMNSGLNEFNTVIGNDVWIGYRAIILNGVTVGDGAIIGAGAVVTKNVEPYSIVAGVPARVIRKRFSDDLINKLLKLQWWNYGADILKGVDLLNVEKSINMVNEKIESGFDSYRCKKIIIQGDKLSIEN